jgi:hypothetical protein
MRRANHDAFRIAIVKMTTNRVFDFSFQFFERLGLREYGVAESSGFEAALR